MADEYDIRIAGSEGSFGCKEGESILDAMERACRKDIFVGCRRGGCGICTINITQGNVESIRPMSRAYVTPQQEKGGKALACCVSPQSDLAIEVLRDESREKGLG